MITSTRGQALTWSGLLTLLLLFCIPAIAQSAVRGSVVYYVPDESNAARRTFIAQRFEAGIIDSRYGPDATSIRNQNPAFRWFVYNSVTDNYVSGPELGEHNEIVALAQSKGWDPEDAYMHYWDDTTIQLQGVTINIPGWGGGSATNPAQARIPVYYADLSRRLTHLSTGRARQLHKEVMVDGAFGQTLRNSSIYADGIFLDNATSTLYNYGTIVSGGHVREATGRPVIGSSAFQSWYWNSNLGPFLSVLHDTLETATSWALDGRPKYTMANVANSWTDTFATWDVADILAMEFQYDPIRNDGLNSIQDAYNRDQLSATAGIQNWYMSNITASTSYGGSFSYAEAQMGALAFYLTARNENSLLQLFGNHTVVGQADWDTLCYRGFIDVANTQLGNPVGAPYVLQQGTDPTGKSYKVWGRDYTNGLSICRTRGAWNEPVTPATAVTVNLPRSLKPVSPATSTAGAATTTFSLRNGNGVFFLNAGPPDLTGPAAITTLSTGTPTASTVPLNWTATGDDGTTGTASSYDIRYATTPISEANWGSALQVSGEPAPQAAGAAQSMTVSGLSGSTLYHFAIKAVDDGGNASPLSNVPSATTAASAADVTAPAAVSNLASTGSTAGTISLAWTSPGDDGLSGTAASYDLRYATAAITAANFASAFAVNGEPDPVAAGGTNTMTVSGLSAATTYYFALKSSDEAGNVSALSNVPTGATTSAGGGGGADTTPPAPVNDLALINVTSTGLTMRWTAPGDDGTSGTAYRYTFAFSKSPITAANFWSAASVYTLPLPQAAGTQQTQSLSGFDQGATYYFAMMSTDEAFNYSALSNVASVAMLSPPSTGDTTPPGGVTDLRMTAVTANSVTLAWTSPGDDGSTGTAASYDLRWLPSNLTPANFPGAKDASGEPAPAAAGTLQTMTVTGLSTGTTYYFALRATDDNGNQSVVSNTASALPSNNPPPTDSTPPAAVTNLAAGTPTSTSLAISWTAPGDDGGSGTATSYDLRRSTSPITAANFSTATAVTGEPAPAAAGQAQSMTVSGLSGSTTYHWAIKTVDEAGNWSALSNVPSTTTSPSGGSADVTPPAATTTLAITATGSTSVTLAWTAPGDDGTSGTATQYDMRWSVTPINDANFSSRDYVTSEPTPGLAGTSQGCTVTGLGSGYTYYFALRTRDEANNWSTLSNVAVTTTVVVPPPDVTAPAAVTNLSIIGSTTTSLTIRWTAPGDDGSTGRATLYDLRYSSAPITAANFSTAPGATSEPVPGVAGTVETVVLSGLAPGTTYHLALKSADEVPNWSGLSNGASAATMALPPSADMTPPAAVTNLSAGSATPNSLRLTWTAPGDDGLTGTAGSYDIRYSTSPIDAGNFALATPVDGEPNPAAAGTNQSLVVGALSEETTYHFALKTSDEAGNVSALSNLAAGTTHTDVPIGDVTPPDAVSTLTVQAVTTSSLTLTWTATGDDGSTGTAVAYDLRFGTAPVTEESFTQVETTSGTPPPAPAGTPQSMLVEGLVPGTTYHFALRVVDDGGNWSPLSNAASGTTTAENTGDTTPPAVVTNLIVVGGSTASLDLRWSAPGDDGVTGSASVYDLRISTRPISGADFDLASTVEGEPIPAVAGTTQMLTVADLEPGSTYYFALRSGDESSNWSSVSNVATGSTSQPPPADTTPPSATVTLSVGSPTSSSLGLSWQSPGDDGSMGIASAYDLRMSFAPITAANFAAATPLENEPTPLTAGSFQSLVVTGLAPSTTHHFAFRTVDEAGNWSGLSNSASGTTAAVPPADTTPPAAVIDLAFRSPSLSALGLTWTAPGDDGTSGRATAYDLRYSTEPLDETNFDSAISVTGVPVPGAAGAQQTVTIQGLAAGTTYYAALRGVDENSNWSPLSNVAMGETQAPPPPPDTQAPHAVNSLDVKDVEETSLTLTWLAPGDDGNVGQAARYDLRFSEVPMSPESFQFSTPVDDEPTPGQAGTAQVMTIPGLVPGTTYFVALRTADESSNWSGLSNVAVATTRTTPPPSSDPLPPAAITTLSILSATSTSLTLHWLATGDDGNSGTAAGYDLRYAFAPLTSDNFDAAMAVPGEPLPVEPGGEQTLTVTGLAPGTGYYLAMKTVDESGNWSSLSNVAGGTTAIDPPPPPPGDVIPPAITLLSLMSTWSDSLRLGWTAPGDDTTSGIAAFYALRLSSSPITEENWASSTVITGLPQPASAGTAQQIVVRGLTPGTTYHFAFKARDDAGNWSSLSPGFDARTADPDTDTAPPLAPLGLVGQASGSSVLLRWNPSADPNLVGYNVYRRRSNRNWERSNFDLVQEAGFTDTTVPANFNWEYAVTAVNRFGQESPRSASIVIRVVPPRPGKLNASMAAPAPNPFVSAVSLMVAVPEQGLAGATLAIVDIRGRLVRTLHHGDLLAGEIPFSWDGVDEEGGRVPAGVYFVRLVGVDVQESRKIVLSR